MLEIIESRLGELDEESRQLQEYLLLDKTRRSLEYAISYRQQQAIHDQLESIEEEKRMETPSWDSSRQELSHLESSHFDMQKEHQQCSTISKRLMREHDLLLQEVDDQVFGDFFAFFCVCIRENLIVYADGDEIGFACDGFSFLCARRKLCCKKSANNPSSSNIRQTSLRRSSHQPRSNKFLWRPFEQPLTLRKEN